MTSRDDLSQLAGVKQALAAKHERLARAQSSSPRKAVLFRRADNYRKQAENIARRIKP